MRRWLCLLLLALVPLQASWGAVAFYCAYDTEATSIDHFGHHDHPSHGHAPVVTAGDDTGSSSGSSAAADAGCSHGHFAAVLAECSAASSQPVPTTPPVLADALRAEHVCAPPDRPQWAGLA